jgi:hypothetical protein
MKKLIAILALIIGLSFTGQAQGLMSGYQYKPKVNHSLKAYHKKQKKMERNCTLCKNNKRFRLFAKKP